MAEVKEAPRSRSDVAKRPGTQEGELRAAASPLDLGFGSPLGLMRRFADEMDHLFEDFGFRVPSMVGRGREMMRREPGLIQAEWSPRVDIVERDGQFLVRADLPGLARDDVKVELTDDTITLQGERKQEKQEDREGYSYRECSYGSFYRVIPLPEGADASKAKAQFSDGVLEVAMPAAQKPLPQSRRLEIQEKT